MRIISGNLENKNFFSKKFKTRPLKDSVRENFFNILNIQIILKLKLKIPMLWTYMPGQVHLVLNAYQEKLHKFILLKKDEDALINLKKC